MIARRLLYARRTFPALLTLKTLFHHNPTYSLLYSAPFRAFGCEGGSAGPDTFLAIEKKLNEALKPVFCKVLNPNGDYNSVVIKIVSNQFEGKLPVQRHRMVNELLKDEIKLIHAVQIDAKTPAQANK